MGLGGGTVSVTVATSVCDVLGLGAIVLSLSCTSRVSPACEVRAITVGIYSVGSGVANPPPDGLEQPLSSTITRNGIPQSNPRDFPDILSSVCLVLMGGEAYGGGISRVNYLTGGILFDDIQ